MSRSNRPRIVRDSRGRTKLKISLPGGRYQLSLDDRGENLLFDTLGYNLRDTVPDLVVRVLLVTGDAWFPHQRDSEQILADLPTAGAVSDGELRALAEYLRTNRVPRGHVDLARDLVRGTALANHVTPDAIEPQSLPDLPSGVFDHVEETDASARATTESDTSWSQPTSDQATSSASQREAEATSAPTVTAVAAELSDRTGTPQSDLETRLERLIDIDVPLQKAKQVVERQFSDSGPKPDIFDIPGVGTIRGYNLIAGGHDSVVDLATMRPAAVAEIPNIDQAVATTIVEGARELVGESESTAARLAAQTGVSEPTFESALAQLAAAGVPPSAAAPTLRHLFGPSITTIDRVDGRMAYFLWEAGYETPWELAQATPDELESVDYLGPTTAERVVKEATAMVESFSR